MNERFFPTQADYDAIDISSLTVDDALNDGNFSRTRQSITEYGGIDIDILRSVPDLTDAEVISLFRWYAKFCVTDTEPDYKNVESSAVKIALRQMVTAHRKRVDVALLKAYQSFVRGKRSKKKSD